MLYLEFYIKIYRGVNIGLCGWGGSLVAASFIMERGRERDVGGRRRDRMREGDGRGGEKVKRVANRNTTHKKRIICCHCY